MAKRKTKWTEEKIARYLKEGRGSGELDKYLPWLTNQDFASHGRTHRPKSWKTNRKMQLFSDLEYSYMYILDWAENVFDIREQFPLDREMTTKIAESKQIMHSKDKDTETPIVMTTDFLITLKDGKNFSYLAKSIKPEEKLNDKRTIEKLEIERQYWENQGVKWGIITEKDIPKSLWKNVEYIHKSYYLENEDLLLAKLLYKELQISEGTILMILDLFDKKYNLEQGTGLSLYKYLLAKKELRVNMQDDINLRADVSTIKFIEPNNEEKIS